MIAFLKRHLTYANVAATLALFIALGGASYAAITLPRNSVGSDQIRNNSIRSIDIRDRTIRLTDISKTARASLRGQRGPQGPTGNPGMPGPSAVRYFAAVNSAGQLVRGDATTSSHPNAGSGDYTVGFGTSTSACAYSATLGSTDGSAVPAGRATVKDAGGNVEVDTYDPTGSPTDLPFFLLVAC